MELSQLKYFLEAARLEHMTRAAENLHIAQPALTQSIHKLENELGVPLFATKGRNVVLTEYGKFLRQRITPAVETIERIPDDIKTMANAENATINISVMAASYIVTHSIIEYRRQHEHINFKLIQENEKLSDITVTTRLDGSPQKTDPENSYVFNEKIFLAVPANGRFAADTSIELENMKNEEFICLAGSKQFRAICDTLCARAGYRPNVIFESDNPTAVKNLIAAGVGVGFWPEYSWGKLNTNGVQLLALNKPVCRRDIIITRSNNKADNTAVNGFFHFLSGYFESLIIK